MYRSLTTWRCPSRVPCSAEEGCESALATTKEASALLRGCPEAGVVGPAACWLDIPLKQVEQCDCVAEPVAEAGVVVLLPLYLAAHGIDDLVKQHRAVCLEDLPLETAAEDEDCCYWPGVMEAKVLCRQPQVCLTGLFWNRQTQSAVCALFRKAF